MASSTSRSVHTGSRKRKRTPTTPQTRPRPHLPIDILYIIASHLDPRAHRSTLATLLRVSSSMWTCTAPHLYRRLHLDEHQLSRLVVGSTLDKYKGQFTQTRVQGLRRKGVCRLTERAQRALGFVQYLTLVPPLDPEFYPRLWDSTASNTPLFPSARQVTLVGLRRHRSQKPPRYFLEPDVYMFGSIDMCVQGGYAVERAAYLPSQRLNILVHHPFYYHDTSIRCRLPTDWERWYEFPQ